jgi:hypothetical protein
LSGYVAHISANTKEFSLRRRLKVARVQTVDLFHKLFQASHRVNDDLA